MRPTPRPRPGRHSHLSLSKLRLGAILLINVKSQSCWSRCNHPSPCCRAVTDWTGSKEASSLLRPFVVRSLADKTNIEVTFVTQTGPSENWATTANVNTDLLSFWEGCSCCSDVRPFLGGGIGTPSKQSANHLLA